MLSLGSIASAIALIPGGGSAVAGAGQALGYLLRCGTCLKILAVLFAVGFTALHVHREEVAHCDERIAEDHRQAEVAAAQRDKDVRDDLNRAFTPKLDKLRRDNQALQDKVNQYAKRKAPAPAGKPGSVACRLGDAAGLLQIPVR